MIDVQDCICGHSPEWHPRGRCDKFVLNSHGNHWCDCAAFVPCARGTLAAHKRIARAGFGRIESSYVVTSNDDLEIDDYPAEDSIIEEG